jgi:hypothetical protein
MPLLFLVLLKGNALTVLISYQTRFVFFECHIFLFMTVSLATAIPADGLFWHFDGQNPISNGRWEDSSGHARHANATGIIEQAQDGDGRFFLHGDTRTTITFEVPTPSFRSSYTLFHRSKYNGGTARRIFTSTHSSSCSWLSGFH